MGVDEAGGDEIAVTAQDPVAGTGVHRADGGDAAALDGDVTRRASAAEDRPMLHARSIAVPDAVRPASGARWRFPAAPAGRPATPRGRGRRANRSWTSAAARRVPRVPRDARAASRRSPDTISSVSFHFFNKDAPLPKGYASDGFSRFSASVLSYDEIVRTTRADRPYRGRTEGGPTMANGVDMGSGPPGGGTPMPVARRQRDTAPSSSSSGASSMSRRPTGNYAPQACSGCGLGRSGTSSSSSTAP